MRTAERDSALAPGEPNALVSARVGANGAIAAGTGLIVTKGATGKFDCRVVPPMKRMLAITATADVASGDWYSNVVWTTNTEAFTVQLWSSTGAAGDIGFSVTVAGLR